MRWWLCAILLLSAIALGGGCVAASDGPADVPPSVPPDAATIALLTGTWEGISTTSTGVQDYLTFEFYPSGQHLRVRVLLNHTRLAEPYADVQADVLNIDAADPQGNFGTFTGLVDRPAERIVGEFVLQVNQQQESGTYELAKQR